VEQKILKESTVATGPESSVAFQHKLHEQNEYESLFSWPNEHYLYICKQYGEQVAFSIRILSCMYLDFRFLRIMLHKLVFCT